MKNGIYIASPEKALLDEVYFVVRGKATLDFDELDIKKLIEKNIKRLFQKIPDLCQKLPKRHNQTHR